MLEKISPWASAHLLDESIQDILIPNELLIVDLEATFLVDEGGFAFSLDSLPFQITVECISLDTCENTSRWQSEQFEAVFSICARTTDAQGRHK